MVVPLKMVNRLYLSVNRKPVGVYVEGTHKDTDHQSFLVEIIIFFYFLDDDDSTISRSYNDFIGIFAGEITNRASEKIDDYCIDDSSECNESFK
jgi:hypothetical protein